jgi:hypothetical protein
MRIFVLLFLFVSYAVAENWPQWRRPLGTGISTENGLPTEWSTKQNLAWQTELGRDILVRGAFTLLQSCTTMDYVIWRQRWAS